MKIGTGVDQELIVPTDCLDSSRDIILGIRSLVADTTSLGAGTTWLVVVGCCWWFSGAGGGEGGVMGKLVVVTTNSPPCTVWHSVQRSLPFLSPPWWRWL